MDPLGVLIWVKVLIAAALAAFVAVLAVNNIRDPGTNFVAVHRMFSMRELRDDPQVGNGVTWRAIDSPLVHRAAYVAVIIVQAVAAATLGWAAVLLAGAGLAGQGMGHGMAHAVAMGDLGLLIFSALWLGMFVVGTWFAYWVKMGPVQQGHLNLLLVGLGSLLVMNIGV